MNNTEKKLSINEYKSEFNFKKNISNLKFSFNRTAFIFFFFILISIIFSIKIFYYGSVSVNNNTKYTKAIINPIISNWLDLAKKRKNKLFFL